ncbi:hypothetical protein Kisp02_24210 [Kineosporia sp. NBRC 101731]|nr:arginine deiminase-related protein [Kineosporia sp. NBRC 101731]GLY29056.1 hypothetical protein Kisp02_24210 [Kineosporia sp. NBRC 101731]
MPPFPREAGLHQAPSAVVMVRPHLFRSNPATLADNSFQCVSAVSSALDAWRETTAVADALRGHGVEVHLFEDPTDRTPDSVFPNNWFTTHPDGTVVLYPMYVANRRLERRDDVVDLLRERYRVRRVVDLAHGAAPGVALEGTGALVLDHVARTAYVCRSHRADARLVARFCAELGYEAIIFDASDRGEAVYHTNVMMAVGTTFAVIGAELIDRADRAAVLQALGESGRDVIVLSRQQIRRFAGNCLELSGRAGSVLALSATAEAALTDRQRARLAEHTTLLPLGVPTIETAGGSVRCMLAGIHLEPAVVVSPRPFTDGHDRGPGAVEVA